MGAASARTYVYFAFADWVWGMSRYKNIAETQLKSLSRSRGDAMPPAAPTGDAGRVKTRARVCVSRVSPHQSERCSDAARPTDETTTTTGGGRINPAQREAAVELFEAGNEI